MKPETVGMSSARLVRLDEVMKRRYVDGGYLPGMLTYIYRKGHLVHTGMCGDMDLERGKPMREDAIFRIYSMSKPITAVALMMLVEEGAIGLDDEVTPHIPAWNNLGVYASGMPSLLADAPPSFLTTPTQRPIKVVDLATHTLATDEPQASAHYLPRTMLSDGLPFGWEAILHCCRCTPAATSFRPRTSGLGAIAPDCSQASAIAETSPSSE